MGRFQWWKGVLIVFFRLSCNLFCPNLSSFYLLWGSIFNYSLWFINKTWWIGQVKLITDCKSAGIYHQHTSSAGYYVLLLTI